MDEVANLKVKLRDVLRLVEDALPAMEHYLKEHPESGKTHAWVRHARAVLACWG